MNNFKIKFITLFIFILAIIKINIANAAIIKIAILDGLKSAKIVSANYLLDYNKGLEVAALNAKLRGLTIEYKLFSYDKERLSILNQIQNVKDWQPDFIIGPRSSDEFVLLKPYFTNTLVISPIATAAVTENLPNNFYSMTLPDIYLAQAMVKFIGEILDKKQRKQIYVITAVDCISCLNIGQDFTKYYTKLHPKANLINKNFFSNDVETIDIDSLVYGYKNDDLIVIPNTSYVSAILIARITNYLKMNNITFIGGDQWGSPKVSYVGKVKTIYPYNAYRIIPWSVDEKSHSMAVFKQYYWELYKQYLDNTSAYLSYKTVMTAISVLPKDYIQPNLRSQLLDNFIIRIKANPHTFHSKIYYVNKVENSQENIIKKIKINIKNK